MIGTKKSRLAEDLREEGRRSKSPPRNPGWSQSHCDDQSVELQVAAREQPVERSTFRDTASKTEHFWRFWIAI